MDELPAEIADASELLATAVSNLTTAEQAEKAAREDLIDAKVKHESAEESLSAAEITEQAARADYIAALRKHRYVQTADGPRPAAPACMSESPIYAGLRCAGIQGHAGQHTASGRFWDAR